jgi:hypothetical protein
VGERSESSRFSLLLVGRNAILVQGHLLLKPVYDSLGELPFLLSPKKADAPSAQMPMQFAQEISSTV